MRRPARLLAVLVVAALAALGPAAPASAHAALLTTAPSAEQVVATAPAEVTLAFSERVGTRLGGSKVFAPDGARVDTGEVSTRDDGREVAIGLESDLRRGTYVVQWRVVSEDSHPITGTFAFSFGERSAAAGVEEADAPGGPRAVLGIARVLGFAGLLLLGGLSTFLLLLAPAGAALRSVRRSLTGAWAALTTSALLVLLAQGPYAAGLSLSSWSDTDLITEVLETGAGRAVAARLALLVVVAGLLVALARRSGPPGRSPSLIALVALTVPLSATFALAGHAGAGDTRALAVTVDTAHLVAVSTWTGGLVALALLLHRLDLRRALTRWSLLATVSVGVVVVTGSFASWREVRSPAALLTTDYGRLLVGKTLLVAAMLVVALGARGLVRRRWAGPVVQATTDLDEPSSGERDDARHLRSLRRSVLLEAGLAAAVVAVTAVLVQTTPARTAYAPTYSGTSAAGDLRVQVDVEPARSGVVNVVHVYLQDSTGRAVDVAEVTGRLFQGESVVTAAFPRKSLGHYEQPRLIVDTGGAWRLELVVRSSEVDSATTVQTIPFR